MGKDENVKDKNSSGSSSSSNVLEKNRIIYLNGKFNESMVEKAIQKLFQLESDNPHKDILIIIDSYGGFVHSLLGLYDAINLIRCDVATLCLGKAMSCGQMLLMCGAKNKRFATKHSRILAHQISSGAIGKLSDMEIEINETKELNTIIESLFKKHANLNKKEFDKLMSKESYMSAKEAKKIGLIDHIVETHNDLYKKINL